MPLENYYFKIVYTKGQTMTNYEETKPFKNQKQAHEHFIKLVEEYKVNQWNQIPTYSYCRWNIVEEEIA